MLTCCSGVGYYLFRQTHTVVDTYASHEAHRIGESEWRVSVRVHTRINDGLGDRLVGPPFAVVFSGNDLQGSATHAKLHAARFEMADGRIVPVKLTRSESRLTKKA